MANGRCHYHGGRTPKADAWHKPRWPNGNAPDVEKKLHRKLRDLDRIARQRTKRLAAMTPDQRERYDEWSRSHKPGSPARRAERRRSLKQTAESLALLERPTPVNAVVDELQRDIDELKRRAAASFDIFG